MRATIVAAIVLGCAGCQMTTGIMPAGPNTYALTMRVAPIAGGAMEAQRETLAEASAYCQSQGREMLPVNASELPGMTTSRRTGYTIMFRCLLPSDPEFRR